MKLDIYEENNIKLMINDYIPSITDNDKKRYLLEIHVEYFNFDMNVYYKSEYW